MNDVLQALGMVNKEEKNAISMLAVNNYQTSVTIGSRKDFETFAKEGYGANSLIYACLSKTAGAAANVSYVHVDDKGNKLDGDVQEIISNPNPYQTQTQFLQTIILHRKIAGVSYWEVERTQAEKPKYLWPLRPDWVTKSVTDDGIQGYVYKPTGRRDGRSIEARDVLEFKALSPLDPLFSGQSSIAPIAGIADTDMAITKYLALFFEGGANITGFLKVTKKFQSTDEGELISNAWLARLSGFRQWNKPPVLDADADYVKTGSSVKDLDFGILDSRNESRICMALDVPPILVGAKVGLDRSTFSNYGEARKSWWEDTLIPLFDGIGDDLNRLLLKLFNSTGKIKLNTSKVIALQEDRTSSWDRAQKAYQAGLLTKNQALEEMGLPTVEGGDVYFDPMSLSPTQEQATKQEQKNKQEEDFAEALDNYFNGLARRIESAASQ